MEHGGSVHLGQEVAAMTILGKRGFSIAGLALAVNIGCSGGAGITVANTGGAGGGAAGGAGAGAASNTGGSAAGGSSLDGATEGAETGGPDTPSADAPAPGAPFAGWASADVGAVGSLAGSVGVEGPANDTQPITITAGGGAGVGAAADAFHFVYREVRGNAEIVGRVERITGVDPGAAAGLMIRESLDPKAAMVLVAAVGDGTVGGRVVARERNGDAAVSTPAEGAPLAPALRAGQWFRLVRTGNTVRIFAGSRRTVNEDASQVGVVTLAQIDTSTSLYVGLAATSHSDAMTSVARFEEVVVDNLSVGDVPRLWQVQAFGISGEAALFQGCCLALSGGGHPWGAVADRSRDHFLYAYFLPSSKPDSRASLTFLVREQSATDPAGRVAAMYRLPNSSGPSRDANGWSRDNATVALSLTQGRGLELQVRATAGPTMPLTTTQAKADLKAPLWLRLDRVLAAVPDDPLGRLLTQVVAYYAPDQQHGPGDWVPFGSPVTFPDVGPADFAALGIAVSSYVPTELNTVVLPVVSSAR
jgi:hypothetical protein